MCDQAALETPPTNGTHHKVEAQPEQTDRLAGSPLICLSQRGGGYGLIFDRFRPLPPLLLVTRESADSRVSRTARPGGQPTAGISRQAVASRSILRSRASSSPRSVTSRSTCR